MLTIAAAAMGVPEANSALAAGLVSYLILSPHNLPINLAGLDCRWVRSRLLRSLAFF